MSASLLFFLLLLVVPLFANKCIISKNYDYIIIGSGTAGSIVASELSSNPDISVLLIEEGGWSSQWDIINDASRFRETFFEPQLDRGYMSQPITNLYDRVIPVYRAKVTGGCGSHNAMQYMLGQQKDFDQRWNIHGWRWNDLESIWNDINNTVKHTVIDPNGIWTQRFIKAAQEMGYIFTSKPTDLANLPSDHTFVRQSMSEIISDDLAQRESSWTAYLEPILGKRCNLDILVYTRVNKILFNTKDIKNGNKLCKPIANGVETVGMGDYKINTFYANKDVILCAGTIDTPKILMLSGIGDCEYLNNFNIECIANVPGVGKNLEEHLFIMTFSPPLKDQNTEIPAIAALFGPIYGTMSMREDGKYHIGLNIVNHPNGKIALECIIGLFQMKSRGEILLTDTNPESKPIINLNIFSDTKDEETWIDAFKECRNLLYSDSLKQFYDENEDEILPGFDVDTDDEILQFGKASLRSYGHDASTCKMGNDFTGNNLNEIVVNNKLQVRSVENLRIVDLSIAPNAPSANTNQIAMIIGFKGAQLILDDF